MGMSIAQEVERAKARGDKPANNFTGSIRSLDNMQVEEGDVFTFPNTYDVFKTKIGNNTAEYIFVTTDKGDVKQFYPSIFTKSRVSCQEDGTSDLDANGKLLRVHTTGTAADLYRQHGSVAKGMEALAGKTVKVSKVVIINTLRYMSTEVIQTGIPTIDLVEPETKEEKKGR